MCDCFDIGTEEKDAADVVGVGVGVDYVGYRDGGQVANRV